MPISAPTPTIYPENLLSSEELPSEEDAQWWVLHTKPRAEKSLARKMQERLHSYFLPTYKHTRRQTRSGEGRGRLLTTEFPLFPSYIFIYGDNDARVEVLKTNLIVNCLPVVDQAQLQRELHAIYRVMDSGSPITPVPGLTAGTPVKIIRGTFAGMTGKVLRTEKTNKTQGKAPLPVREKKASLPVEEESVNLVIEVTMLGCGAKVEIEPWMVSPLPGE